MKKRIVIAKYLEDTSWSSRARDYDIDVVVYDKSDPGVKHFEDRVVLGDNHIKIMNVGRESHTYLTHIIDNYDNLYDFEIFLQGRISDHICEDIWTQISKIDDDTKYIGFSCLRKYQCFSQSVRDELQRQFPDNRHVNLMDFDRAASGKYTDTDFFEIAFGRNTDPNLYFHISVHGIFGASKSAIRRHPKQIYQKYLDLHNPNLFGHCQATDSAYKMEHLWEVLFTHGAF